MIPSVLTLSLTVADGPILQPARQRLSLFASGMLLKDDLKFSGCVSERGEKFRDFDASPTEFQELCRTLDKAGLTERLPQVEQVVDTSDSWAWVLLHVAHEKGAQTLTLGLLSSSYKGPDAPALQRFFEVLLSVAGVRDGSILHDLVGP